MAVKVISFIAGLCATKPVRYAIGRRIFVTRCPDSIALTKKFRNHHFVVD